MLSTSISILLPTASQILKDSQPRHVLKRVNDIESAPANHVFAGADSVYMVTGTGRKLFQKLVKLLAECLFVGHGAIYKVTVTDNIYCRN